jgi:hypothetical protein
LAWLQGTDLAGDWVARTLLEKLYQSLFTTEVLRHVGWEPECWPPAGEGSDRLLGAEAASCLRCQAPLPTVALVAGVRSDRARPSGARRASWVARSPTRSPIRPSEPNAAYSSLSRNDQPGLADGERVPKSRRENVQQRVLADLLLRRRPPQRPTRR